MNDWNVVITECSSLAAKWEQLSAYLSLPANVIDIIKRDNSNKSLACWNEALKQWIMQNYDTDKFGNPTWRSLLGAIAKLDKLMFKKLVEKYQGESLTVIVATIIHCSHALFYQLKPSLIKQKGMREVVGLKEVELLVINKVYRWSRHFTRLYDNCYYLDCPF